MARRASLRVRAFAKINLTLRVLGRRADGYHDLRTVFQALAMHDTLVCKSAVGPLRLACDDSSCPADETNLVWRAAECVWRAARRRGSPRDVSIQLRKRIPIQAGLGGGSSDAAAALRALAAWWRVPLTDRTLRELGATLGADVPFLLEGGTALGVGRGDVLFPLPDLPAGWVVIVAPSFGISTADAYQWWDEEERRGRLRSAQPASASRVRRTRVDRASNTAGAREAGRVALADWLPPDELTNDLQASVVAHHPLIGRLVERLWREGASYAAMSGSGSAVFGLFSRQVAAAAAAVQFANLRFRVVVTRTRSRAECRADGEPW